MANPSVDSHALSERAQHLLKVLIERYIRDGQPVGSRVLAKESRLDLSPASVRNVMADLEELGLVTAPHTSAGRVPTVQGYRLFVDSLITVEPLQKNAVQDLASNLKAGFESRGVVEKASHWLSAMTHMAGVVMYPRRDKVALRHVEFLRLSDRRVLVILVTNDQEVQNRIIECKREYSAAELEQAANYLTHSFAGHDLQDVRSTIVEEMRRAKEDMDRIMLTALEMGERALSEATSGDDFALAGETNLMTFSELADMGRLRNLFESFHQKNEILHLLDQCLNAARTNIFIGNESGYGPLDECSVVTAPYRVEDRVVGVLGVIGPTRMQYEKVIPIVDITAKLVGAALKPR